MVDYLEWYLLGCWLQPLAAGWSFAINVSSTRSMQTSFSRCTGRATFAALLGGLDAGGRPGLR